MVKDVMENAKKRSKFGRLRQVNGSSQYFDNCISSEKADATIMLLTFEMYL